jgi:hypothetical protein
MNKHFLFPLLASGLGIFTLGIPGVLYMYMGYPLYATSDVLLGTHLVDTIYTNDAGASIWPLLILFALFVPPLYIVSYSYFQKKFQRKPLLVRSLVGWYVLSVIMVGVITTMLV